MKTLFQRDTWCVVGCKLMLTLVFPCSAILHPDCTPVWLVQVWCLIQIPVLKITHYGSARRSMYISSFSPWHIKHVHLACTHLNKDQIQRLQLVSQCAWPRIGVHRSVFSQISWLPPVPQVSWRHTHTKSHSLPSRIHYVKTLLSWWEGWVMPHPSLQRCALKWLGHPCCCALGRRRRFCRGSAAVLL